MKRECEQVLAKEMLKKGAYNKNGHKPTMRDLIAKCGPEHGFVEKQALATLEKWTNRGWYDYGTTIDLGWLTPEGIRHFTEELQRAT